MGRAEAASCVSLSCHSFFIASYLAIFRPAARVRLSSHPPRPRHASPDGKDKYFVSGNYTARIVIPDNGGRPMQPWVTMMVDSFLLPLNWKL